MATIAFTALGTALGGPLGGALGSLVGNQLDRAVIGGRDRSGARVKELSVTTSSYGTPLPRHYGTMRSAGSIVWATDLKESGESTGGGKGRPATTNYSYSASFAVALASRPIRRVRRIWADGNLLRGSAGDLKVGGALRIHTGHGDQLPDPLIASDKGPDCPAFRGRAYCVFESLQLAEFGNRIPALTFEIVADEGEVELSSVMETLEEPAWIARALPALAGFSDEGGPLSATLATIDQVYPLAWNAGGEQLTVSAGDGRAAPPIHLPEPAVAPAGDGFGPATGTTRRRLLDTAGIPEGIRYYDLARDYQAGMQRAEGRAHAGFQRVIDFPGALAAGAARHLAHAAAERAGWARETLSWRMAELNPALGPGSLVCVPGHVGTWYVENWEWREGGVELDLKRAPRAARRPTPTDPGEALPAPDLPTTPTRLAAFELPWDGAGAADARRVFAAVSSQSEGWTGAALYAERGGDLVPLGSSGRRRSVLGCTVSAIPPSSCLLLERGATIDVALVSDDFDLIAASPAALAGGANRALIGDELIQFAQAERTGPRRWRLGTLLRGRGGSEGAAQAGRAAGEAFVLLDDALVALDPARLGQGPVTIAALGLADDAPVETALVNPEASLRPLTPVHPSVEAGSDGGLMLRWTRRARGAWHWTDEVDAPLVEPREAYLAGLGSAYEPVLRWELDEPRLRLSASTLAMLAAEHPGKPLWVRQIGAHALSPPLLLHTVG